MRCPECGGGTEVIDSRPARRREGAIRRRRQCGACERRFTTYELPEAELPPPEPSEAELIRMDRNRAIRELLADGVPAGDIADGFGLSRDYIYQIGSGRGKVTPTPPAEERP